MQRRLIELLEKGRGAYAYPYARILAIAPKAEQLPFWVSRDTMWACVRQDRVTDLALDEYHGRLLRSRASRENVLGGASTVFWGYVTRNQSFACHKASRLVHRNDEWTIHRQLKEAAVQCAARAWGEALGKLATVSELGRVSFASKVVAFLEPDNAGVYDQRINRFLFDSELKDAFFPRKVGRLISGPSVRCPEVSFGAMRELYQEWCRGLQAIRDGLNHPRVASRWRSGEDRDQPWRALDVERAIFAFTLPPRGSPAADGRAGGRLTEQDRGDLVRLLKRFLRDQNRERNG